MGRPRQYTEDRVTTAVRLPKTLHQRLTEEARNRDTSVNHLLVRAAAYYLDHALPPLGPTGDGSGHESGQGQP